MKLDDDALVIEKRVLQAAYTRRWLNDDGSPQKPETVKKAVSRAVAKLVQQGVVRIVRDGPKTWITRPAQGVP